MRKSKAQVSFIDDVVVWHGGVNLLGHEDIWDNLIRINSATIAAELLNISLGDDKMLEIGWKQAVNEERQMYKRELAGRTAVDGIQ